MAYDEEIFKLKNTKNLEFPAPYYGQMYIDNIQRGSRYDIVLLLNTTSQSVVGAYGALAHKAILTDYLKFKGKITNASDLKFNLINSPFPISRILQGVASTIAGTNAAFMMTIAWLMISDSLLQNLLKERDRNIKHQIMVSGCSIGAYWAGNYIADVVF